MDGRRFELICLCTVVVLVLSAVVGPSPAYGRRGRLNPTLEVHGGFFLPAGDWAAHRYAAGVDHFRGGLTGGGELAIAVLGLRIGLYYDYSRLGTSQWEDFARRQGDDIAAAASMKDLGCRFHLDLWRDRRSSASMNLSVGHLSMGGTESYAGRTFDYDFLHGGLSLGFGVGFTRVMAPHLALALRTGFNMVVEGIGYADGEQRDVYWFPATLGLIYRF